VPTGCVGSKENAWLRSARQVTLPLPLQADFVFTANLGRGRRQQVPRALP
jgi:hypothetical protein